MARIPHCDFQDDGCDDPRCRTNLCILRNEDEARIAIERGTEAAEVQREAEKFAVERLKQKGISKPTQQQIDSLAQDSQVIEEAKKRVEFWRSLRTPDLSDLT